VRELFLDPLSDAQLQQFAGVWDAVEVAEGRGADGA
jgi:hypothetical protein